MAEGPKSRDNMKARPVSAPPGERGRESSGESDTEDGNDVTTHRRDRTPDPRRGRSAAPTERLARDSSRAPPLDLRKGPGNTINYQEAQGSKTVEVEWDVAPPPKWYVDFVRRGSGRAKTDPDDEDDIQREVAVLTTELEGTNHELRQLANARDQTLQGIKDEASEQIRDIQEKHSRWKLESRENIAKLEQHILGLELQEKDAVTKEERWAQDKRDRIIREYGQRKEHLGNLKGQLEWSLRERKSQLGESLKTGKRPFDTVAEYGGHYEDWGLSDKAKSAKPRDVPEQDRQRPRLTTGKPGNVANMVSMGEALAKGLPQVNRDLSHVPAAAKSGPPPPRQLVDTGIRRPRVTSEDRMRTKEREEVLTRRETLPAARSSEDADRDTS